MTKRPGIPITLVFLLALVVLIVFLIYPRSTSEPKAPELADVMAQPDTTPQASPRESVVLPQDFDWSDQDAERLENLFEQVQIPEDTHTRWNYEFDAILQPGESLITDGWEVSEGVFQFTTLTPNEVTSDGETFYQIATQITEVDLSGEVTSLNMPRIFAKNRMEASLRSVIGQPAFSNGELSGEPESGYYLNITPQGVPEGIWLRGNASGLARKQ